VECFNGTDVLILTDVYSAHEDRAEGAGIKDIYSRIDRSRFEHVDLLSKEEVPEKISRLAREGDTVLVLGAGDIREVSPLILQSVARGAGRGQVTRG
jgi:UDP-N-acetylmuramate--alanine ligase